MFHAGDRGAVCWRDDSLRQAAVTDPLPALRPRARPWIPGLADVAYAPMATALALLLLWFLHGIWQPWWALACGLGTGVVLRRVVAQAYAAFPPFLCRPLDAGVVMVGTFLGSWATLAGYPLPYWVLRWREALTLPAAAALLGMGIAAVVYTFRRLQLEIEDREARLAALREAELRARLRALQAQINPHFLFNALNSLAEMVHGDADEAEQMVGDLAHLLRYSLRSSASGMVTLDQEMASVRRYLRLEGVRLGDRLRVEEHIADDVATAELPGLVLQPLVENAVKHAVAPRPEGGIVRVEARRDGDGVTVVVEDDGPGLGETELARYGGDDGGTEAPAAPVGTGGAGGGLASAQQRLTLARRGRLRVGRSELGGTRIELRLED